MRGSRGEHGVRTLPPPPPNLKNHKALDFLSNTGHAPLKNHKASKPAFDIGPANRNFMAIRCRADDGPIEMASRWRADDGPILIVVFGSYLS